MNYLLLSSLSIIVLTLNAENKKIANVKLININLYENTIKSNDNGRKNCVYETMDELFNDASIQIH